MFKFIQNELKNKKGFTLVELVVVIAILGILSAIAVPRLGGFRESAAQAADKASAATIANTVMLHYVNVGAPEEEITFTWSEGGEATSDKAEEDAINAINAMLVDGNNNYPKPQAKGKTNFVAVVDTDGSVKVGYDIANLTLYPPTN